MDENPRVAEWQRQSGQYQRPAPPPAVGGITKQVMVWLTFIPILATAGSFLASYAGKAYREGETQQRLLTAEVEIKRLREDAAMFNEKYVTQKYLDDRVFDLRRDRQESEDRLMKRLDKISADLK